MTHADDQIQRKYLVLNSREHGEGANVLQRIDVSYHDSGGPRGDFSLKFYEHSSSADPRRRVTLQIPGESWSILRLAGDLLIDLSRLGPWVTTAQIVEMLNSHGYSDHRQPMPPNPATTVRQVTKPFLRLPEP